MFKKKLTLLKSKIKANSTDIDQLKNEEIYKKFRIYEKLVLEFEEKSNRYQEHATQYHRRKLLSDLDKRRQFYQKNEYIDKKIEFDQRFFSVGYQ